MSHPWAFVPSCGIPLLGCGLMSFLLCTSSTSLAPPSYFNFFMVLPNSLIPTTWSLPNLEVVCLKSSHSTGLLLLVSCGSMPESLALCWVTLGTCPTWDLKVTAHQANMGGRHKYNRVLPSTFKVSLVTLSSWSHSHAALSMIPHTHSLPVGESPGSHL